MKHFSKGCKEKKLKSCSYYLIYLFFLVFFFSWLVWGGVFGFLLGLLLVLFVFCFLCGVLCVFCLFLFNTDATTHLIKHFLNTDSKGRSLHIVMYSVSGSKFVLPSRFIFLF